MGKILEKVMNELYNRDERENFQGIEINNHKIPDPKLHQQISFIKSGIRILGYVCIPFSLVWATVFLVLSEVVGIIEELV